MTTSSPNQRSGGDNAIANHHRQQAQVTDAALAVIGPMTYSAQRLAKIDKQLAARGEHTRWQATIALGKLAESAPGSVWPLVLKHGSRRHADVRTAIATCVLEHLLEYHFDTVFPTMADAARRSRWFRDTFRLCWRLGQANVPRNARRWRRLERQLREIEN